MDSDVLSLTLFDEGEEWDTQQVQPPEDRRGVPKATAVSALNLSKKILATLGPAEALATPVH
jgi:hypothetical protein